MAKNDDTLPEKPYVLDCVEKIFDVHNEPHWTKKELVDIILGFGWTRKQLNDFTERCISNEYTLAKIDGRLCREGEVAKVSILYQKENIPHLLISKPSKLMFEKSEIIDVDVESYTTQKNKWKLPGGKRSFEECDYYNEREYQLIDVTGTLLLHMTALREVEEEIGHHITPILRLDNEKYLLYDNTQAEFRELEISTSQSRESEVKAICETANIDLHTQAIGFIHWNKEAKASRDWDKEVKEKYPGVPRKSKLMFVRMDVVDPMNQISVSDSIIERSSNDSRSIFSWLPINAYILDNLIDKRIIDVDNFKKMNLGLAQRSNFPRALHPYSILDTISVPNPISPHQINLKFRTILSSSDTEQKLSTQVDTSVKDQKEAVLHSDEEKLAHDIEVIHDINTKAFLLTGKLSDKEGVLKDITDNKKTQLAITRVLKNMQKFGFDIPIGFRYKNPKRLELWTLFHKIKTVHNLLFFRNHGKLTPEQNVIQTFLVGEELIEQFSRGFGHVFENWKKKGHSVDKRFTGIPKGYLKLISHITLRWLAVNEIACNTCGKNKGEVCKNSNLGPFPNSNTKKGSYYWKVKSQRVDLQKLNPGDNFENENEDLNFTNLPLTNIQKNIQECVEQISPNFSSVPIPEFDHTTKLGTHSVPKQAPFACEERWHIFIEQLLGTSSTIMKKIEHDIGLGKQSSASLTQQNQMYEFLKCIDITQETLLHRRTGRTNTPISTQDRMIWDFIQFDSPMSTYGIDDFDAYQHQHKLPILKIVQSTSNNKKRLIDQYIPEMYKEKGDSQISFLEEPSHLQLIVEPFDHHSLSEPRFHWLWGEHLPTGDEIMEDKSLIGFGKVPIISPYATLREAHDVAATCGGFVAISLDAYVHRGLKDERQPVMDRLWNIDERAFQNDNENILKRLRDLEVFKNDEDVYLSRTLAQQLMSGPPHLHLRRILGVLSLDELHMHL